MSDFIRREIMGYPVLVDHVHSTAEKLAGIALRGDVVYSVAAADVHVVTRGIEKPDYGKTVLEMDLICPDGMPLVKLLNKGGKTPKAERVSGPDLMDKMLGLGEKGMELRHFFLGSTERTLSELKKQALKKYPSCEIAGSYSPLFGEWNEGEYRKMAGLIRESGANVVWVGLGCPKQEAWIRHCSGFLPPAVYLAVGAAFDFHAGTVRRAPLWMQKHGLEWFYRLLREPRRLCKRYMKYNSLFLYYVIFGKHVN